MTRGHGQWCGDGPWEQGAGWEGGKGGKIEATVIE